MTSRRTLVAAALLVTLSAATSCSDDTNNDSNKASDTTTKAAISKAEFLTEGNALCTSFNATAEAASATVTDQASQIVFFTDVVAPGLRDTMAGIEALGFPAGDEALLQGLIDDTLEVLDTIEADPAAVVGSGTDPFASINQQLADYGLTVCGQAE
ncbi:MAG: hypothetical protein K8R99_13310 [Actinomycetia bacterium]|nr:hypothetical protein [Actinomycetes bacterium]